MQDFDALKEMWDKADDKNTGNAPRATGLSSMSKSHKQKLERQQIGASIMLCITGFVILAMALFGNFRFEWMITYIAMFMMTAVCWAQSVILFFNWKKIRSIDETHPPRQHLQEWETYYAFRKKQLKWNGPLYFIALNLAMGMYFIEIFRGRPVMNIIIFVAAYVAWMLFAYLYLGKKNLRKEESQLMAIIQNLKALEEQF